MIEKCDAIRNDDDAADASHLPIQQLAEIGCVDEALQHVDRFLRRLPKREVLGTVQMAELGAKISLDVGDLTRMERYLAIAEATEPFNTRKCDKGFSIRSVREFRAENGLLDPADAMDEEQRVDASFEWAARRCVQAIAAGQLECAMAEVAQMENVARMVDKAWLRQSFLRRVIEHRAQLMDGQGVKRCLRRISKEDRHKILDSETLMSLGMQPQAIARARQDIAQELATLRQSKDPNIHFHAMTIGSSLEFLVAHGAKAEARRWLRRVLKEMPTWPAVQAGWATSAVWRCLAQAAAAIDGPGAADAMLKQAAGDAKAEKRRGFGRGAVQATLDLKADLVGLEGAIEEARRLRSPIQRRDTLATLFAKAGRWSELREVLSQARSPKEAADMIWAMKFALPGGEAR